MAFRKLPEQQTLLKLFNYDQDTGIVTRLTRPNNRNWVGEVVGSAHIGGYLTVCIDGISYLLHRVIWKMVTGEDPVLLDHGDGVRTNNRWRNLNSVSEAENCKNQARSCMNKSGVIGVCREARPNRTGKWIAQIGSGPTHRWLGAYPTFEQAVAARKAAEVELGYNSNHGRDATSGCSLESARSFLLSVR